MTTRLRSTCVPVLSLCLLACEFSKQLGDTDSDTDGTSADDGHHSGSDSTGGAPVVAAEDAAVTMAAARCSAWFACECSTTVGGHWTSQADCEAELGEVIDVQIQHGLDTGLVYDPACVAEFIAYYDAPSCAPFDEAAVRGYEDVVRCNLFHGVAAVGEACDEQPPFFPTAVACAADLVCSGNTCIDVVGLGEPCSTGGGHPACEFPLFCDPDAPEEVSCNVGRAVGEPCNNAVHCAYDGQCIDDVCVARALPGEPCTTDSGCFYGVCDATDVCVQVPTECIPWGLTQTTCEGAREAVEAFIAANQSCETAADCVAREAQCAESSTCGSVSLAADHDAAEWTQRAAALEAACDDCGSDPCGFDVACKDGICGFGP